MSRFRGSRAHVLLTVAFLLGSALLLSCQPAQPAATPRAAEKAPAGVTAAAPTKAPEKAAEKPVRGGVLRYVQSSESATLDPQAATGGGPSSTAMDLLVGDDPNMNLNKEDGLARDWAFSADGMAITFKLREGVKSHDGTDFDAAAVKFNVERMQDPATKAPYASNYATVASVDVVDNLTVRFNLKRPDPMLLPRLAQSGGFLVSPAAVKKYGQDFGRNPVGSGPFQFVEWVPGDRIIYKKFEGYWAKDKSGNKYPYLDQVVFKFITDETSAVAALRTGQVDLYTGQPGFPPAQLPLLKSDPNLTYTLTPNSFMNGVYLNTKRPPFDNKALRQAVALAVDREGIAALYGEGAKAQASILHPMNIIWGADPKVGVFPSRDVAKAKAKMAEAGYPSGGLKVKYTALNTIQTTRAAEVIKANLAEIGIEAEIEVVASAAHTTKTRETLDYQIALGSYGANLADPGVIFSIGFHSKGSRNYYGPWSNPKIDELIDKAGSIYDQKERVTLYNEAAKIIAEDMPYVPIFVQIEITGMNKKVHDYITYPVPGDLRDFRQVWMSP